MHWNAYALPVCKEYRVTWGRFVPRKFIHIFIVIVMASCILVFLRFQPIMSTLFAYPTEIPTLKSPGPLQTHKLKSEKEFQPVVPTHFVPVVNTMAKMPASETTGKGTVPTATSTRDKLDSIRHTAITREEIEAKFKRCQNISKERNPQCAQVHANPAAYWKSSSAQKKSHDTDFKRMNLAAECCAFNFTELMTYDPRDPPFEWERDYLSQPPLQDMADTAWAPHSGVTLINNTGGKFTVGDKVVFKVLLRNGKRQDRSKGGDSVRLWLASDSLGASIAPDVTDLNNGSYLATTVLPWSGEVKVRATIAHTRELFRANLFIQRLFKITHGFTTTFSTSAASEATPCLPFPALPGYKVDEICNMTVKNGGFPWFCGKPVKSEYLNCSHSVSVKKINAPSYYPLTAAEEELVLLTETKRPFMIPNNITITVKPKLDNSTTLPQPRMMCNQRKLSLTFNDTNQSGYFYKKRWRPVDCQLPKVDKEFLLKCLSNREFLILGDSNSRKQMEVLHDITGCTYKIPMSKLAWHAPLQCDVKSLNVSIKYFPPKHPFYGSVGENLKQDVLHSPVKKLDDIPDDGNYIVLLHNFLHMVPSHLSLVEHRLRLLRQAIERLLARNPRVLVIYQSTHTAYDRKAKNKHKMNVFLLELQRSILKGLGERVMFALTWPLTVATANDDGHPKIKGQFMELYMGYICGR